MFDQLMARLPQQSIERHLLVDEGEVVIDTVRHHNVVYGRPITETIIAIGMWLIAIFGPIELGWLFILGGIAVVMHAAYIALREQMDIFVITNMRVFRAQGVFSVRIATMPIARILDITVHKPLMGRILGYGHFVFESAAHEQGVHDIRFVGDPDGRDLTIQRVIQRSGVRGPIQQAHQ